MYVYIYIYENIYIYAYAHIYIYIYICIYVYIYTHTHTHTHTHIYMYAQVMLQQNEYAQSYEERLVNGSRGVVIAWDNMGYPIVRFKLQSGGTREKTVVPVSFVKTMYLNKTLSRSQVNNLHVDIGVYYYRCVLYIYMYTQGILKFIIFFF